MDDRTKKKQALLWEKLGQDADDINFLMANALPRYEFIEFLTRIVKQKYIEPRIETHYPTAIRSFFETVLTKHVEITSPWQGFRDKLLYNLDINDLYLQNLDGLKRVFKHWTKKGKKMDMKDAFSLMTAGLDSKLWNPDKNSQVRSKKDKG